MSCRIGTAGAGGSHVAINLTFRTTATWTRLAEPLLKVVVARNAVKNVDRLRRALDTDARVQDNP